MITTPNLGLKVWNLTTDPYDSGQLADNWARVDEHDHASGRGSQVPTAGIEDYAITLAKLAVGTNIPPDASITTAKLADLSVTSAKILDGTITNAKLATPSGKLVQMVSTQTGAVATGTTAIPVDNTIPQITEGDQYMTLGITPNNASNILFIQVVAFASTSALLRLSAALFVGSTANALAAISLTVRSGGEPVGQAFNHQMVAGDTSALTFRVRIGSHAGGYTTTFNGQDNGVTSTRLFGGVAASSITITEFTP